MKIAFFEMEEFEEDFIKDKLGNHELKFFDDILDGKNVGKIKDIEVLVVFVHSEVNKSILDKLSKVRLICAISTGFDNIDLKECERRGIKVCNVPDYAGDTVAEHTFALILALTRRITESWDNFRKNKFGNNELRGIDLKGKTLGVVGVGTIGHKVVKIAKGFEMKVIAYDVVKNFNVKYVSLDYLLRNSDIVSLHCPLNEHTEGMMGRKEINKMKKGAIFINTARGELVDTSVLVKAVKNNKLRGIGLDVLENEEEMKEKSRVGRLESGLLKMGNVILTPHNAFNSEESIIRLMDGTVENIRSFIKGKVRNSVKAP